MFLTILLILAAVSAFACGIYLTIKIYFRFPGKNEELEQKYLSIFIASFLLVLIFAFSAYYAFYIGNDISHADILVTDMTRLTTAPLSDVSFKTNMTNLISNRLGYGENPIKKKEVYDNLNKSVIIDPINYFQSKAGQQRFGLTPAERATLLKVHRRGGMMGSGMGMYRAEESRVPDGRGYGSTGSTGSKNSQVMGDEDYAPDDPENFYNNT
jgi:hypothetical protein